MISSLAWVRKGAAARHPQKFNITDEDELQRVQKLTNLEFGDAQQQLEEARKEAEGMDGGDGWQDDDDDDQDADESMDQDTKTEKAEEEKGADEDELAKYKLDTYDEEQSTGIAMGAFSNIKGLSFYKSNDDDPYITLKDGDKDIDGQDDDDEEREALEVLPSDNLLISAKTEDDVSLIEAHVYAPVTEEAPEGSSLYVHHDLLLPSFPLCLEWLSHSPAAASSSTNTNGATRASQGNYLAVSTMDPEIEIWNMDIIDGLVPSAVLGNREASKAWEKQAKKKGTGKKKRRELAVRPNSPHHHTDAVLCLSWNPFVPNLLASSSADGTVKLWDLDAAPKEHGGLEALRSFEGLHSDKVQSVAWNTAVRSVLASGGYDGQVKIFDVRQPGVVICSVKVDGEIEKVRWNPWRCNNLLVSLDSGLVHSYDVDAVASSAAATGASQARSLFTLSAHSSACTSMDISPHIPGCLVTAGLDRQVKLWNLEPSPGGGPKPKSISLVASRDVGAGKVFAASFSPDEPLVIAAAGSSGKVKVWDAGQAKGVASVFGERVREFGRGLRERRKRDAAAGEDQEKEDEE
ncbi:WD40 repeat-like protein, partial [Jaminaea rosea]